ncbi:MAG: DUF4405 domain-containing protein [Anaerolineaceae bacterium]|nr:DUF4405 domain-containing protein [Anaerolineaceae bacterium]
MNRSTLSPRLRHNWLIDAVLFLGALFATLTGIYFFVYPIGGFMGGRNPDYGVVFLFGRETWEFLHDWTGILMIAAAIIHVAIHWRWIFGTLKRITGSIFHKSERFGSRLLWTIIIDSIIAISFLLSAVSGLYFFFIGKNVNMLFNDLTWDLIHTWSFVGLLMAFLIHIILHWTWIKNITAKIFKSRKSKQDIIQNCQEMSY